MQHTKLALAQLIQLTTNIILIYSRLHIHHQNLQLDIGLKHEAQENPHSKLLSDATSDLLKALKWANVIQQVKTNGA